jgi:WD40 repeat protein/mono/diheme cytochrome c family protein
MRRLLVVLAVFSGLLCWQATARSEETPAGLAARAQAILKRCCHRCHGQDGSIEGGMNYLLDRDKLVARNKIRPGSAARSSLFRKVAQDKMPPPGEKPRPSDEEKAILQRWIDTGAPRIQPATPPTLVSPAWLLQQILADLDQQESENRRFLRYFSLAPQANAGAGADELQTYRNALAKVVNSLSWSPRIVVPVPVDPRKLILRIDLRDIQWDHTLWNRLLEEYPYGVVQDGGLARAVMVTTGTRLPHVRADWFIANATRAPLYYDLLQMPTNAAELERQLRVDVGLNLRQRRASRAGFLGSGISRNNRLIERHDSLTGAYWRTYDFEAIPQNLQERDLLLPDRRNLFAYPLGPGGTENLFQHAGGEIIFNLPNGLQGYMLVDRDNQRINKGATAIVSDPKRPDRAVEAGVSCMGCHVRGILPKEDQIRAHVEGNARAFSLEDQQLIRALYPPKEKMARLMEEDAARFRQALAQTGNRVDANEVVIALTLRHEEDVDLPTLAAEAGVTPEVLRSKLDAERLTGNLGALKVPGGTVARDVVAQTFADLIREARLGRVLQVGLTGENLPDLTGEVDPLETQSNPANAATLSPDGRLAAFAGADRTIHVWDVGAGRDQTRLIGHTASVWALAFSPEGKRLLSGGMDGSVRLWDLSTGEELRILKGHTDLVTAVCFHPAGRRALSAGLDGQVILWDLTSGKRLSSFQARPDTRYLNSVAFAPDGKEALLSAGSLIYLVDAETGKERRRLQGHSQWLTRALFSPDGKQILSASDDGTVRLWDRDQGKQLRVFNAHAAVPSAAFHPEGNWIVSGSADTTVRIWDARGGEEVYSFDKPADTVIAAAFSADGTSVLAVTQEARVHRWRISKESSSSPGVEPARHPPVTQALQPVRVLPVGGTVGSLHVPSHGGAFFYLNRTEGTITRVDARTWQSRSRGVMGEPQALRSSPSGKRLITLVNTQGGAFLQVLDPETLAAKEEIALPCPAFDLVVIDDQTVFLSGPEKGKSLFEVSLAENKVVRTWKDMPDRAFLSWDARHRHLCASGDSRFVILDVDSGKQRTLTAPPGVFATSPDGQFLLFAEGSVLRSEDGKRVATTKPWLSLAFAPGAESVFALTREGTLLHYSYPDFQVRTIHPVDLAAYGLAWNGRTGQLYVAGFDPAEVSRRPRARGYGEVRVYSRPHPSRKHPSRKRPSRKR